MRSVHLHVRTRHQDAESLRRHLARARFSAETRPENPINLTPEEVRQIVVHLSSIADNSIGALVASIITWAITRRRALIAAKADHKVQVSVGDDGAPALRIMVSKDAVALEGQVPDPPPPKRTLPAGTSKSSGKTKKKKPKATRRRSLPRKKRTVTVAY
jgi:hypothetical protein